MPDRSESLRCEAVLDSLESHIDGDLDDHQRLVVAAHLESCPACAAEQRLAIAVQTELRQLPELDAPAAVLADVMRRAESSPAGRDSLLSWPPRRRVAEHRAGPRRVVLRRALLAAAVLATAVLGWELMIGSRLQPDTTDDLALQPPVPDQAEIAQATAEARYALAYLTRVSRRTGLELKEGLLMERLARPTARRLGRSLLTPRAEVRNGETTSERNRS